MQALALSPVRRLEVVLVVLAAALSSLWCVTASRQLAATFDEPFYVREGLNRWRTGSMAPLLKLGTMPLPVDVQTLPLYLHEHFTGSPFDADADFDRVLPWARAGTLLFWWMLLFYGWRIARSLGGPWAGVVAVLFLAFEPSLLAHAGLATTDIAVAACLLGLLYHFQKNREQRWGWRVAWPALWFGLAVLAKASGLVFGGLCLLAIEAARCSWWRKPESPRFRESFRDLVQIGLIGLVLVFVYCGSDWKPEGSFVAWAHTLPKGRTSAAVVWVAEHLRIFTNAGNGLARQFTHNVRGHGSFLLGQTHPRAFWYYFPVLLTIKLTVPLLLGSFALLVWRRLRRGGPFGWPLHAALALLLFSPLCRVQIGIRFMFPLIALVIAGLAPLLVDAIRSARRRYVLAGLAGVCLAWTIVSTVRVWPHGLCYVNPLWGGTRDGYRLVSEGNYDWGQGVKELVRWQQEHHLADLDAWVFTSDPLAERMPIRQVKLHTLPIEKDEDFLAQVRGRHLAVSVTFLHGAHTDRPFEVARHVLHERQPVARTTMYHIFDFTKD